MLTIWTRSGLSSSGKRPEGVIADDPTSGAKGDVADLDDLDPADTADEVVGGDTKKTDKVEYLKVTMKDIIISG